MDVRPDPGPPEDTNHPIPRLDTYDTLLTTARGAHLGIVIAAPLKDDERSRGRLQRKFEACIGYVHSAEYIAQYGEPQPDRCRIYVSIHSESDPQMLQLVEQHCTELTKHGITPVSNS